MGCSMFVNCLLLIGALCGVAAGHRLSRLETRPTPIPLHPSEYLQREHYNNYHLSNPTLVPQPKLSNLAIRTETRRWDPTGIRNSNSSAPVSTSLGTKALSGTKPSKSITPAADVFDLNSSPKLPSGRPSFVGLTTTALPYAATPHTYYGNKYIPLRYQAPGSYQKNGVESDFNDAEDLEDDSPRPKLTPVELILTLLRTVLDVVRGINKNRATTKQVATVTAGTRNNTQLKVSGRGFDDYYDEHHYHQETTTSTQKPKARYTDPWAGYYDFIINEGSFKFWSVFQLFTAALLLYACFSAIYYAKFNPTIPDYDREYDDYFLERTVGRKARSLDSSDLVSGLTWMNPRTFQFIMDAISSHYGGDTSEDD